jgi:hypothetical protein
VITIPTTYAHKYCKSIASAERFQAKLYKKYDAVKLVEYPYNTESGFYTFACSGSHGYKALQQQLLDGTYQSK